MGQTREKIISADVPTTHKEKVHKTDKIDSRKLSRELENNTLNSIYIPEIFEQKLLLELLENF